MQTFDQSLMLHLKSGVVSYEEALRQASNPDDFALRVSGVSGTSDSKWDSFEKPHEGAAATPAQGARPAPQQPGAAARPGAPGQPAGRATPAKPGAPKPGGGDDDFQIERF
jgi:twitching motility protein PilT